MSDHQQEVMQGKRFEFGQNWAQFLEKLDDQRIEEAIRSLQVMLGVSSLVGKKFADVGSGSGLFSLAARRLGAEVTSFDFDPKSVACTNYLRDKYYDGDAQWSVSTGSVLDPRFLADLGKHDIVYSWGVLHHTGKMWDALANVAPLVADGGKLFIAIYNDQGRRSRWWLHTKKAYNALPRGLKWIVLWPSFVRLWAPIVLVDSLRGKPFDTWINMKRSRGMDPWRDVVDWVGGLPFEVATPDRIFHFYFARGFALEHLRTEGGGHGCNEFVFRKTHA